MLDKLITVHVTSNDDTQPVTPYKIADGHVHVYFNGTVRNMAERVISISQALAENTPFKQSALTDFLCEEVVRLLGPAQPGDVVMLGHDTWGVQLAYGLSEQNRHICLRKGVPTGYSLLEVYKVDAETCVRIVSVAHNGNIELSLGSRYLPVRHLAANLQPFHKSGSVIPTKDL